MDFQVPGEDERLSDPGAGPGVVREKAEELHRKPPSSLAMSRNNSGGGSNTCGEKLAVAAVVPNNSGDSAGQVPRPRRRCQATQLFPDRREGLSATHAVLTASLQYLQGGKGR